MDALVLSLVLAARPTIAVEVASDDPKEADALRGWLAARLLEEGYDLGPTEDEADGAVRVQPRAGGLEVEASGPDGQRRYAVEDGPAEVQRLEVLHRALMGVEATSAGAAGHRPPGLAIRFEGAPSPELLAALATVARDRGLSLSGEAVPGDALACVTARGGLAEVGIGPAERGCAPSSLVVALDDPDAAASELVGAATPLLPPGAVAPDPAAPVAEDPERAPIVAVVDEGDPVALIGPPRAELRLAVDGGIVSRGPVDAAMRAFTRLGRYEGIGGRLELAVIPSGSSLVRVVDTLLMVGPDWQIDLTERLRFQVAALIGTDIQTWVIADRSAAGVAWSVGLPLELSLALRGDSRLHLAAVSGMSGVPRSHRLGDEEVWERNAWRVGGVVGFSYGWRIE